MSPSNSPTITSGSTTVYNFNIMERLGGYGRFELIVLCLVDRLKTDQRLAVFFSNFDIASLIALETQFLTTAFTKDPQRHSATSSISIRHFNLIHNKGFNEVSFDILVEHLVDAMGEVWVDADVIVDAIQMVKSFRSIFEVVPDQDDDGGEDDEVITELKRNIAAGGTRKFLPKILLQAKRRMKTSGKRT
eukprot:CAMPEP_0117044144 /NCGR_PEP_ID=MMETSP0472-20121206/30623_1 /TAXON_ID=693140 ORGANISM="Tiarina fusus, Strain LIS" /NCGR_SAMPLE_ID=MMETSP0472 /ASSEMBLY_ACC=CAM_ASM_000603 /LENGTH=189 /DNA_ID=CAMNT_0004755817 /DNA_START=197 /DNA_END=763 /DNA_ORIENTATION=-